MESKKTKHCKFEGFAPYLCAGNIHYIDTDTYLQRILKKKEENNILEGLMEFEKSV